MTQREFFTAVANNNITNEVIDKANELITALDTRNEKRASKPSKTAIANEPIIKAIVEVLTTSGKALTSPEIAEKVGVSVQKASALCTLLAKEDKLVKSEVKVPKKGTLKAYSIQ